MNKLLVIFLIVSYYLNVESEEVEYSHVILKTCKGCALKNYPEVMEFVEKDSNKYGDKLKIDYEAGGVPRFVCVDKNGEDARVLDISKLKRKLIRVVLQKLNIVNELPLDPIEEKVSTEL